MLQSYYFLKDESSLKGFTKEDAKKFEGAGKDPFETEDSIKKLVAPSSFVSTEIDTWIEKKLAQAYEDNDKYEIAAWNMRKTERALMGKDDEINAKFFAEFMAFLTGRTHKDSAEYKIIQETLRDNSTLGGWKIDEEPPCMRQDESGEEIRAYIETYTGRYYKTWKKALELKMFGPRGGLNDHWLYFYFIVKGAIKNFGTKLIPDVFTDYFDPDNDPGGKVFDDYTGDGDEEGLSEFIGHEDYYTRVKFHRIDEQREYFKNLAKARKLGYKINSYIWKKYVDIETIKREQEKTEKGSSKKEIGGGEYKKVMNVAKHEKGFSLSEKASIMSALNAIMENMENLPRGGRVSRVYDTDTDDDTDYDTDTDTDDDDDDGDERKRKPEKPNKKPESDDEEFDFLNTPPESDEEIDRPPPPPPGDEDMNLEDLEPAGDIDQDKFARQLTEALEKHKTETSPEKIREAIQETMVNFLTEIKYDKGQEELQQLIKKTEEKINSKNDVDVKRLISEVSKLIDDNYTNISKIIDEKFKETDSKMLSKLSINRGTYNQQIKNIIKESNENTLKKIEESEKTQTEYYEKKRKELSDHLNKKLDGVTEKLLVKMEHVNNLVARVYEKIGLNKSPQPEYSNTEIARAVIEGLSQKVDLKIENSVAASIKQNLSSGSDFEKFLLETLKKGTGIYQLVKDQEWIDFKKYLHNHNKDIPRFVGDLIDQKFSSQDKIILAKIDELKAVVHKEDSQFILTKLREIIEERNVNLMNQITELQKNPSITNISTLMEQNQKTLVSKIDGMIRDLSSKISDPSLKSSIVELNSAMVDLRTAARKQATILSDRLRNVNLNQEITLEKTDLINSNLVRYSNALSYNQAFLSGQINDLSNMTREGFQQTLSGLNTTQNMIKYTIDEFPNLLKRQIDASFSKNFDNTRGRISEIDEAFDNMDVEKTNLIGMSIDKEMNKLDSHNFGDVPDIEGGFFTTIYDWFKTDIPKFNVDEYINTKNVKIREKYPVTSDSDWIKQFVVRSSVVGDRDLAKSKYVRGASMAFCEMVDRIQYQADSYGEDVSILDYVQDLAKEDTSDQFKELVEQLRTAIENNKLPMHIKPSQFSNTDWLSEQWYSSSLEDLFVAELVVGYKGSGIELPAKRSDFQQARTIWFETLWSRAIDSLAAFQQVQMKPAHYKDGIYTNAIKVWDMWTGLMRYSKDSGDDLAIPDAGYEDFIKYQATTNSANLNPVTAWKIKVAEGFWYTIDPYSEIAEKEEAHMEAYHEMQPPKPHNIHALSLFFAAKEYLELPDISMIKDSKRISGVIKEFAVGVESALLYNKGNTYRALGNVLTAFLMSGKNKDFTQNALARFHGKKDAFFEKGSEDYTVFYRYASIATMLIDYYEKLVSAPPIVRQKYHTPYSPVPREERGGNVSSLIPWNELPSQLLFWVHPDDAKNSRDLKHDLSNLTTYKNFTVTNPEFWQFSTKTAFKGSQIDKMKIITSVNQHILYRSDQLSDWRNKMYGGKNGAGAVITRYPGVFPKLYDAVYTYSKPNDVHPGYESKHYAHYSPTLEQANIQAREEAKKKKKAASTLVVKA